MRLSGTHLFTIDALLGPVVDVGVTPTGHRRVIPVVGGTVTGGLRGAVLPGGADWNLQHPDGSTELWARYEIRLDDGAVVSVTNTAVHAPDDPAPILTTPHFDVGADGPVRLRTGVHVGLLTPRLDEGRVRIEVHRLDAAET
ncbi:DUF3237 family protein [Cellulomonas shaoxiangyii]|uniref:DUF3237 family protein n=1 Tax=Cellulomonas shaoxiangyii TaxID=2566013 RepID=A0A4P7SK92_9CELL|nr:DUF3237 family protein [Cellulomonas shaoxiangyii]QCB93556.1 DUF3237 family protein [Cellulomonas shaoxiangyii]TGY86878.1 DUF3237 family protein [Cellulomonas shaoxiangyii]